MPDETPLQALQRERAETAALQSAAPGAAEAFVQLQLQRQRGMSLDQVLAAERGQGTKADELKVERALMRSTGKGRAAVREALRESVAAFREKLAARAAAGGAGAAQPVAPPPPPKIEVETTTFAPRALTLGSVDGGQAGDSRPSGMGIPDQTITINNDGSDFVTITGSVTNGLITLNFEWLTTGCADPTPP